MRAAQFSKRLLDWHSDHGRTDLPWQRRRTPYRVWVSEIMLQQTQVNTVIPYYQRFIKAFPGLRALAESDIDEVLHFWTGLGYYARARNLHRTARTIVTVHGGRFPKDIEQVKALPGIGRSTAGAILALACDQRHPILDGNVKRVLTRFHALDGWPGTPSVENALWVLAERYTPEREVARYTQAVMDLGATVCTRGKPMCTGCPLADRCLANARGAQDRYPARRPRKVIPQRATVMMMLQNGAGEVLLERRPPSGIWGGLWSFPEATEAQHPETSLHDWCEQRYGVRIATLDRWPALRHTFTHFRLDITPIHARVETMHDVLLDPGNTVWYNSLRPDARGLAAPVKRLLAQLRDKSEGEHA